MESSVRKICNRSTANVHSIAVSLLLSLGSFNVLAQTPVIAVESASPFQEIINPGGALTLKYKFSVNGSTTTDYKVFVHIFDADGNKKNLQDDHFPPTRTPSWRDVNTSPKPDISYTRPAITIPSTGPDALGLGTYRVVIGLYDPINNNRLKLSTGPYTDELSTGSNSYVVSFFTITNRVITKSNVTCGDVYASESTWPDKTTDLNAELSAVSTGTISAPGVIYKLPMGGCKYNQNLLLSSKTNVDVVGLGVNDTILIATDKNKSAFKISGGNKVRVRDFSLRAYPGPGTYACNDAVNRALEQNGGKRSSDPHANGILVDGGSDITIERTRIGPVFGGGMFFGAVNGGAARANEIYDTMADGIHVTGSIDSTNLTTSTGIIIENNTAKGTGDDSFSSVGVIHNGQSIVIQGTQIKDNTSVDNCTSGVTIEGTENAVVSGNSITRSGLAGVRVASESAWGSGGASSISISGNTLDSVRNSCDADHPAILIYSNSGPVTDITVSSNTITNPRSPYGIRAYSSSPGTMTRITASNNNFKSTSTNPVCTNPPSTANMPKSACVVMEPSVTSSTVSGNKFQNSAGVISSCP